MAGLYIHIPFCKQACHYCDFHFSTNTTQVDQMVEAIVSEIGLQKDYLPAKILSSIYFGGGTPSLLSEKQLLKILDTVRACFRLNSQCEITLEANPDDLSIQNLKFLRNIGINRLSIGIQSFDDTILTYLNRAHNSNTATSCVDLARQVGFNNISIDLMYAIPNQSIEDWKSNIQRVIEYSPEHISAYALTIEPKTVFGNWESKKKITAADEGTSAEQFEVLMLLLEKAGYQHYEISNFSKSGRHSQHNSSYWKREPYLGVGPSAHSFNLVCRQYNIRSNAGYLKAIAKGHVPAEVETLSLENKINEFILTTMRTDWGCNTDELKDLYAYDLLRKQSAYIAEMRQKKLVLVDNQTLKLTSKGKLFADKIISDLFVITT